jgi:hypothetical protein
MRGNALAFGDAFARAEDEDFGEPGERAHDDPHETISAHVTSNRPTGNRELLGPLARRRDQPFVLRHESATCEHGCQQPGDGNGAEEHE